MSESHQPAGMGPPKGIDTTVAHSARVWNYWLGGKDNFEPDIITGGHVAKMFPLVVDVARADREFLGRAVEFLAGEAGIRQFLDVGTGLPSENNTHEVAQRVAPNARVVYVDNDPLVLVHARALLTSAPSGVTDYIEADARDPKKILAAAERTLDYARPVAVMMLGVLNFIIETDQARASVRQLMDAVPSGSYLAITHPTYDVNGEANREAMRFWNENAKPPICARSREQIEDFFADSGLELLEPGIVPCSRWRNEAGEGTAAEDVPQYGAVARKP